MHTNALKVLIFTSQLILFPVLLHMLFCLLRMCSSPIQKLLLFHQVTAQMSPSPGNLTQLSYTVRGSLPLLHGL